MSAERPLRVLSVNAAVIGGGAERVALTLHERYLARGIESWLAVGNRNAEEPGTLRIPRDAGRSAWARMVLGLAGGGDGGAPARWLRVLAEPGRWLRVARGHEDFDFPWTAGLLELPPAPPTVLHLHNLHGGYFDIRALPALSTRVPTIITMHDTWLLTGHCAQPFECTRWREGCGACPDLGRYVPVRGERTTENREVKRRALLASKLGLAAPSRWLLSMAEEAGVLGEGREGRVIPNGVDIDVFTPGDRAAARERLGLPQDRPIVLLAARGVRDNPFKGFDTLVEAFTSLPEPAEGRVLALALGDEYPPELMGCVEFRGVPFVEDSNMVADYYRASDVFVHPSRSEAFGLVLAEAMACGTPVVASDVGGVPEVVMDGESGVLFRPGSAESLAASLASMLANEGLRQRLAEAGVQRVRSRFSIDTQLESYLEWYAELQNGGYR